VDAGIFLRLSPPRRPSRRLRIAPERPRPMDGEKPRPGRIIPQASAPFHYSPAEKTWCYNHRMTGKPVVPRRGSRMRRRLILFGAVLFLLLVATGIGLFLLSQNTALTSTARDIFLILLALEFMVVGVAVIVLAVQIARLTLLLEMEIRPMLENANDTLDTLRGTSLFLSESLVEPVVKLQSTLAGIQRVLEVLGLFRKSD